MSLRDLLVDAEKPWANIHVNSIHANHIVLAGYSLSDFFEDLCSLLPQFNKLERELKQENQELKDYIEFVEIVNRELSRRNNELENIIKT